MFLKVVLEELVQKHKKYQKRKLWISHDGDVRNSDFENQPLHADSTGILLSNITRKIILPLTKARTWRRGWTDMYIDTFFYASEPKVPEALCFRVVRPSVRPSVRMSVRIFRLRDNSSITWWNFIKLGQKVKLDVTINWLDFGWDPPNVKGQRSMTLV